MSTTPEDDNSRKHSRSDDGEEEKKHGDTEQENSPKRSRASSDTSAQPPTSTAASEGATESDIGTSNSGDHGVNASNDTSINPDTAAAVPQPSVVSTGAPTAGSSASLPHQEIPQCDVDEVDRKFREKFPVGKWYATREELEAALHEFADEHLFVMRREAQRAFVCSRCPNTWSKKKSAKEVEVTKKEFSGVTDCPVIVRHSKREKQRIAYI